MAFAVKVKVSFRGQMKILAKTSQGGIFFTGQPHSKEKLEEDFRTRKGIVKRVEEWLEGPTLQLQTDGCNGKVGTREREPHRHSWNYNQLSQNSRKFIQ